MIDFCLYCRVDPEVFDEDPRFIHIPSCFGLTARQKDQENKSGDAAGNLHS